MLLTATAGFALYNWMPLSFLSQPDKNITVAYPPSNTTYYLSATDTNNCLFKDTMAVKVEDCPNTIYFPNAFTPNNDGLNDTYKPVINGNIITLKFTIYNRFGQIVFQTRQPLASWDGKISGQPQQTGAFIWTCEYQFKREKPKKEKGSLMLIR